MNIPIPRLATALCVAACLACGDAERVAAPPAEHDASSRAPADEPVHGDDAAHGTPRPHAEAAHADRQLAPHEGERRHPRAMVLAECDPALVG